MERCGLTRDVPSILARITVSDSLEDAVAEADYVQESVFERVDVKHRISLAIGAAIRADAIVGSSSSGIPASEFTGDVQRRERLDRKSTRLNSSHSCASPLPSST